MDSTNVRRAICLVQPSPPALSRQAIVWSGCGPESDNAPAELCIVTEPPAAFLMPTVHAAGSGKRSRQRWGRGDGVGVGRLEVIPL